jgi:hypothetical protein
MVKRELKTLHFYNSIFLLVGREGGREKTLMVFIIISQMEPNETSTS